MAAPLRRVVNIVTETRPYTMRTAAGVYKETYYTVDFELLECGHRRKPKDNALLGGTDIGNAKRRRCEECAASADRQEESK